MKKALKIVLAATLGLIATIVLIVGVAVIAFFAWPDIHIEEPTARKVIARFVPETIAISFDQFSLHLLRGEKTWLQKKIVLEAKNLCVQYEKTAVDTCIEDLRIALIGGFGGEAKPGQSRFIPHIVNIEPLRVLGADIKVDLTAFPKDEEPKEEGGFDFISFLRKEILPNWDVEGSRVQVKNFFIRVSPEASYSARFDLQPGGVKKEGEAPNMLEAILHEVKSNEGPLRVRAEVDIQRPQSWGGKAVDKNIQANAWKVLAEGLVEIGNGRNITVKADSNITGFNELDFRIQTFFKGIDAIKELRLEGAVKQEKFDGLLSAKLGATTSEFRALDFVNCAIDANLDQKVGGVRCGPQAVRVELRERSLMKRPDLFVLAPEFEFRITRATFDETKSADFTFSLIADHINMLRASVQLSGSVESKEDTPLKFSVKGRADAVLPEFLQVTEMLRRTPYSIPAPLNVLDGAIGIKVDLDVNQDGGAVNYEASTRLDSTYQSMHLDFKGKTTMVKRSGATLTPETEATLSILKLYLSAPRFDLRVPPAFKTDSRFGKIDEKALLAKKVKKDTVAKSKFKLVVKTASPEAIRIATNLTKASVPISVDVTYDSSVIIGSPVSGWVLIGRTPVELFKRNAHIESLRVDLMPSGDNRLDGRVSIKYLEYAITVLLTGPAVDPQVRFSSDPPLDDSQIISVLLFGQPRYELGEDEQSTVANTKAAMADAVLGISSLYLLASTPIESVGYDPESGRVTARMGLGGGATLELGAGSQATGSGVGFRKRISREFIFRSDVETLGTTGERTVSALIEWVKRF